MNGRTRLVIVILYSMIVFGGIIMDNNLVLGVVTTAMFLTLLLDPGDDVVEKKPGTSYVLEGW